MSERELPKIGVAAWIVHEGKLLMGKRRGESGGGMWCPPGGHLEMFETFEECVARESQEEAGIAVENIRFMAYTNQFSREKGKHYVTHHFRTDLKAGEPRDLPEETIGEWGWFTLKELPQPLFYPVRNFLENGYNPLNF